MPLMNAYEGNKNSIITITLRVIFRRRRRERGIIMVGINKWLDMFSSVIVIHTKIMKIDVIGKKLYIEFKLQIMHFVECR